MAAGPRTSWGLPWQRALGDDQHAQPRTQAIAQARKAKERRGPLCGLRRGVRALREPAPLRRGLALDIPATRARRPQAELRPGDHAVEAGLGAADLPGPRRVRAAVE